MSFCQRGPEAPGTLEATARLTSGLQGQTYTKGTRVCGQNAQGSKEYAFQRQRLGSSRIDINRRILMISGDIIVASNDERDPHLK